MKLMKIVAATAIFGAMVMASPTDKTTDGIKIDCIPYSVTKNSVEYKFDKNERQEIGLLSMTIYPRKVVDMGSKVFKYGGHIKGDLKVFENGDTAVIVKEDEDFKNNPAPVLLVKEPNIIKFYCLEEEK